MNIPVLLKSLPTEAVKVRAKRKMQQQKVN